VKERAASDPLAAPSVTPEQLRASMPPRVRAALPRLAWTEDALWRLEHPVEDVSVESFTWLLDLPLWRWQGRRFQLSLRDVLSDPERYRAHWEKAERADTAFPIHVIRHRGRWVILDGYHRLLKTLARGGSTVRVMKVSAADLAPERPERGGGRPGGAG
jgi:hypothetical protein